MDVVSNRMEEMGLAEPNSPVDKKGVVVLSGKVGHSETCRICKLIAWSNNKIIEGVLGAER